MAEKNVEVIDKESKQYIVVMVGSEQYGIDISYIDNIVRMQKITRVPKIQSYFKGVINLRGTIVPIIDMRVRFQCPQIEYNQFTVVIILNLRDRVVGIVVDSVSDVMALPLDAISPAPDIESVIDTGAIVGLGSVGERMLILLDIEKLMGNVDMGLVAPQV